ncbi:putative pfkB family carbohydrate kinase [Handroanthus impetiginosus]|uniref:Putative pfkB family carbohydrate kinase n=1 Tax=Handroanthus impetiginosus TaxID=429701 RepID=A0A2G9H6C1_9LAMI|nr:putative pfkB family carbohydrate kinase [Handroanthus impetiginosus]
MGIEIQHQINNENDTSVVAAAAAPVILGLQPSALVDHVARVDRSLLSRIPGEPGGSFPVAPEELKFILSEVNSHINAYPESTSPLKTIAGGSVANTIRGLAAGFGISCGIIGACGDDEEGNLFVDNMSSYKVDLSRLRRKKGPTAQCVCLVDDMGNRTMRPCLSNAVKIQAEDLTAADLKGSKWLVMRYSIFNIDVIQAAVKIAKQEGVSVSLDLASFEMVRKFRLPLLELLESRSIDLCFANEDEAAELLRDEDKADPESALDFLSKYCQWAVVTLGAKGCIAKHRKEVVQVPAIGEAKAVDATGAGDLFASGFLYGLVKGLSLEECCKIGSCSGGSVIRSLGGEVTPENWQWMYKQMYTKGLPIDNFGVASSGTGFC